MKCLIKVPEIVVLEFRERQIYPVIRAITRHSVSVNCVLIFSPFVAKKAFT